VATASPPNDDSSANLFTVGQQTRTVPDIGDPAHAPGATLARISRQRFCPDTEEITGQIQYRPPNENASD
jgi:hypothetical protein